jgi:RNA polymerase sigma-70 factor (ECF subfamily)
MNRQTNDLRSSFEQLVREHGGLIHRIARRFAADGTEDDLVQDILMRLWRSYQGFRGDAKLETWIYRVCLNAAMTHVSATVRTRALREAVSTKSAVAAEGETGGASTAHILSDFLNRLGDVEASILMMYMDGLTAAEISDVLGIC